MFANDDQDVYEENFGSKLNAIQASMNSWRRRYLTMKGRITIIKTLLPKLTHILVSLPKPSKEFMKRLKTIMFHFIWSGKIDRLKRLSICKPYSEGGLAMIEIDTYVEALKTTWVRREMKSNHSWTSLFEERISKGICLWEMNGQSLVNFSNEIINPFWIEVLRAYANISNDK